MSQNSLSLLVRDANRQWRARLEFETVVCVVAALSADPTNLDELSRATERFMVAERRNQLFRRFRKGRRGSSAAKDANCVIDLPARLIVLPWNVDKVPNAAPYLDQSDGERVAVPYHLDDEWLCTQSFRNWLQLAEERRRRPQRQLLDRQFVYGQPLWEFITEHCSQAAQAMPSVIWDDQSANAEWIRQRDVKKAVQQVHVKWLSHKPSCWSESVRDALLANEHHLEADLCNRCIQWELVNECPVSLNAADHAYRYARFTGNEYRLYFHLVRHLIQSCLEQRREWVRCGVIGSSAQQLQHLSAKQVAWLNYADHPNLVNRTPAEVIESLRRRVPLASEPGEVLDCDCPICRIMADDPRPSRSFWYVPALDKNLPQVFHGNTPVPAVDWFGQMGRVDKPVSALWNTFRSEDAERDGIVRLYSIAACTAELVLGIRTAGTPESDATVQLLNRSVDNLIAEMRGDEQVVSDGVVGRYCEALDDVSESFPSLRPKAEDLQDQAMALLHLAQAQAAR